MASKYRCFHWSRHIDVFTTTLVLSLICNCQLLTEAYLEVVPLWNGTVGQNDSELCSLTVENIGGRNTTVLRGNPFSTCSVQLTSSLGTGSIIEIPQKTPDTVLYVEQQDTPVECQNRYVDIATDEPCSAVFSQTAFLQLFLQGNTSVLISDTPTGQSSLTCPDIDADAEDPGLLQKARCITNGYNRSISCSTFSEHTSICYLKIPSTCDAILGSRYVDFKCPDDDYQSSHSAFIIYPNGISRLDISNQNLAEITKNAFLNFRTLEELDLRKNRLSELHPQAFSGLVRLKYLNLFSNQLYKLHENIFDDLSELQKLYLDNNQLTSFPKQLIKRLIHLETLALIGNQISSLHPDLFNETTKLSHLFMDGNNLHFLPNQLFRGLFDMKTLIFGRNKLISLERTLFLDLPNLHTLILSHNVIREITYNLFWKLKSLVNLRLSYNKLSDLNQTIFKGLSNLKFLFLDFNKLRVLDVRLFNDTINLRYLEISGNFMTNVPNLDNFNLLVLLVVRENVLTEIDKYTFNGLPKNAELIVSQSEICECYVPVDIECTAVDIRSSYLTCDRLLSDRVLVVMMWLIGLNALGGNLFVLFRKKTKQEKNKVQNLLLSNLATSDLLMGIYMLIIACADIYFGEYFPMHAETWRHGVTCRIAAAISIISSQASVFFVTLISIDRFINIRLPHSHRKLRKRSSIVIISSLWMFAIVLGVVPSVLSGKLHAFYDNSHVCIGLPLASDEMYSKEIKEEWSVLDNVWYKKHVATSQYHGYVPGSYYATAVFIGLNGFCYFIILLCYVEIVRFVFKSSKRAGLNKDMKEQIRMTVKVAAVVLTDFLCWSPIILLGILVQSGALVLPPSVFAWSVTVILPINSAINPYLYTIAAIISNRRKQAQISPSDNQQESSRLSNPRRTMDTRDTELQSRNVSVVDQIGGERNQEDPLPNAANHAESNV